MLVDVMDHEMREHTERRRGAVTARAAVKLNLEALPVPVMAAETSDRNMSVVRLCSGSLPGRGGSIHWTIGG